MISKGYKFQYSVYEGLDSNCKPIHRTITDKYIEVAEIVTIEGILMGVCCVKDTAGNWKDKTRTMEVYHISNIESSKKDGIWPTYNG